MELIIQDRGTGKTIGVICASHQFGYPIVAPNRGMVEEIKRKAKKMNISIPDPITVNDLRNGMKKECTGYEKVLIDEVYPILGDALKCYLGCEVVAATMTDVYREEEQKRWRGL